MNKPLLRLQPSHQLKPCLITISNSRSIAISLLAKLLKSQKCSKSSTLLAHSSLANALLMRLPSWATFNTVRNLLSLLRKTKTHSLSSKRKIWNTKQMVKMNVMSMSFSTVKFLALTLFQSLMNFASALTANTLTASACATRTKTSGTLLYSPNNMPSRSVPMNSAAK